MLVSNPMKFHPNILNSLQVTEHTRPKGKFCYFLFQRVITRKKCNPELQFLCSAHCLMLVHIPMKFHHGVFNGFQETEQTRF